MAGLLLAAAAGKVPHRAPRFDVALALTSRVNLLRELQPELTFLARRNSVCGKTVKVSGCGRITAGMTVKDPPHGRIKEGMKFLRSSEFPLQYRW